jgi:hypothetical protein
MPKRRRKVVVISSRLKAFGSFSDAFGSSLNAAWKVLRGSWSSSSNKGYTSTGASSYPLAVVKMSKANVTAQVKSVDQGAGIAIWATDSGNWWGVVTAQQAGQNCNCQTCSTCNAYQCNAYTCNAYTCNAYQCNASSFTCTGYACNSSSCGSYNTFYCASFNGSNCAGYVAISGNCKAYNKAGNCNAYYYSTNCAGYNSSNCAGYAGGNCAGYVCNVSGCASGYSTCNSSSCSSESCTSASCTSASCSSASYYSCNCATCYPALIRLIKSVSNVVTEVTTWAISQAAASLKVITNGTGITARAYSDNNLSTQIGSDLTYTATGATIDTQFGIVVAPSTYAQGASLDDFSATAN